MRTLWHDPGRKAVTQLQVADFYITRAERMVEMANDPAEPLGEADLEAMKSRLDDLAKAEAIIEKAIRGGIDMSGQRTKARELRTQLTQLKNSFFPGR